MLIVEETMEDQTVPDGLPVPPRLTLVGALADTEISDPGALPDAEINDQVTSQQSVCCEGCGRPPGPVAAPGVTVFDLGVKHCLNRLADLIASIPGISRGEANAIVLKLQARDVEL